MHRVQAEAPVAQPETQVRDLMAGSIHQAHGGEDNRNCFLCRRSAAAVLETLQCNGFAVTRDT